MFSANIFMQGHQRKSFLFFGVIQSAFKDHLDTFVVVHVVLYSAFTGIDQPLASVFLVQGQYAYA